MPELESNGHVLAFGQEWGWGETHGLEHMGCFRVMLGLGAATVTGNPGAPCWLLAL